MTLQKPPLSVTERRREREMQHELLKFHRDSIEPVATMITKKRLRVPRVEMETNPFCMERQLADGYAQLNFNKNPRFYTATVHDGARVEQNPRNHSSFINQSADLLASSHVMPRVRPEFSTLPPATSYSPAVAHFLAPQVVSVDSSDFRQQPDPSNSKSGSDNANAGLLRLFPPAHEQYSVHLTSQTVTFGHRPSSAARMFDHLSNTVGGINGPNSSRGSVGKKSSLRGSSTPVKTGMSVMQLTQLLTPGKATQSSALTSRSGSNSSCYKKSGLSTSSSSLSQREAFDVDVKVDEELKRQNPGKARKARELELEREFKNPVYYPPRERKVGQFPPPTDQTTAQLIDKYRKLAVGKLPDMS